MKLYHVYRKDNVGYDEYESFLLCVNSEKEALHVARHIAMDTDYWPEDEDVVVKAVGVPFGDIPFGLVMESFNGG